MRLAAIVVCLALPVAAYAGEGPASLTCDQCVDFEEEIFPTPVWQTVAGSTTGTPNSEYVYSFCAVAGGTYTFTTCDAPGLPGSATYDTALSVWTIAGTACGTQEVCDDDECSGGSSGLLSTIDFVAPADDTYLVVVDGFSGNTGDFVLGYMGPECATPVDTSTWGSIKATYND